MRSIILAATVLIAAPSLAMAQSPSPSSVTVAGSGRAERPADFAWLSFTLRGEGTTAPSAITALSTARAKIEASLATLPSRPTTEPHSDDFSVREVRGKACEARDRDGPSLSKGDCAVIGSLATLNLRIKVSPAQRVGDAASLVAQLGGAEVSVSDGGVVEEQLLKDSALQQAIADARRQAQLIATAAGVRLGRVLSVQTPPEESRAFAVAAAPPGVEEIVVTGAQLAVPFALDPPPIVRTARLLVTYALEP